MKTKCKLVMAAFAMSALLLPGQALAMDNANSANVAASSAPLAQSTAHIQTAHIQAASPKRKIRIVKEPLPKQNQATRTDTHSRFVIATDRSNDTMKVFKAVKQSKSMPNLFTR